MFSVHVFQFFSEGKIAPDEPSILPPSAIVPKSEKRKSFYGTPQSKRLDYRDRDWDRERDRDFELMPPPGSHKKEFAAPLDIDQPIDPNEPTYCVCHQVQLLVTNLFVYKLKALSDEFFRKVFNCFVHLLKCCTLDLVGVFWRHDCL